MSQPRVKDLRLTGKSQPLALTVHRKILQEESAFAPLQRTTTTNARYFRKRCRSRRRLNSNDFVPSPAMGAVVRRLYFFCHASASLLQKRSLSQFKREGVCGATLSLLTGCVSQVQLADNKGQRAECSAAGLGIISSLVAASVQQSCLDRYQKQGYHQIAAAAPSVAPATSTAARSAAPKTSANGNGQKGQPTRCNVFGAGILMIIGAFDDFGRPRNVVLRVDKIDSICGHSAVPCLRRARYRTLSHRRPKAAAGETGMWGRC